VGSYFGHAMSKACQYAYNDSKVSNRFLKVTLKIVKIFLQKTIIWIFFLRKGNKSEKNLILL
jgi:hypothetical protein